MSITTGFVYYYKQLAMSTRMDYIWIITLLLFELLLGIVIIQKVSYTEIDWIAYMQEVSIWYDDSEYNYQNIRGDTGPLVYPAGFLYLFWILRFVTDNGKNIHTAQYIFLFFYIATQTVVLLIYQIILNSKRQKFQQQQLSTSTTMPTSATTTSTTPLSMSCSLQTAHYVWSWRLAMTCLCLSKRMHSIFMLRLFNDGPTMLLLYMSILLFMHHYWNWGCFIFSLAVSCKMNILLYAPGLLLLLLQVSSNFWYNVVVIRLGLCCALPQLILGAPFLLRYPISYLRKAFELDRIFFFKWTVNFKFLSEIIFISKSWALSLLTCHLITLIYYMTFRWLQQTLQQYNNATSITTTSNIGDATTTTTTTSLDNTSSTTSTSRQKTKSADHDDDARAKKPPPSQVLFFIQDKQLSSEYIVYTLMVSNFIGIVFARTLHYQFYSWYFHSLPLLMWCNQDMPSYDDNNDDHTATNQDNIDNNQQQQQQRKSSSSSSSYPVVVRILLLVIIENSFLTFPATALSSMLLQMAHFAILWQIQPPQHVFSSMIQQPLQRSQPQQQHDSGHVTSKKQN